MKLLNILFASLFAPLLLCGALMAQNAEQLAIPLSQPGEPGRLELGVVRGSISVSAYEGEEVIIRYGGDEDDRDRQVTREGLRRISSNAAGFEVTEEDNVVEVGSVSPLRSIDFRISVPRNFSLKLSTVNGGALRVENVSGEMELSNVNGPITLTNIGGSVVANTVNGDITATFRSVADGKPMSFTNLNGEIDVTFPPDVRMNAKMRSEWGDVFTDFEMEMDRSGTQVGASSTGSGTYKVTVNNWITGTVNGGGPEYQFRSMRGDIYIRRNSR